MGTSKRKSSPTTAMDGKATKKSKSSYDQRTGFYSWDDKGTLSSTGDGSMEHNRLKITIGRLSHIVMVGDSVLIQSESTVREGVPDAITEGAFVGRVERMWQEIPKKRGKAPKMKMRACWYYKKSDLESLEDDLVGPMTKDELLAKMTDQDLVLSNQSDDNDIETIMRRVFVVSRRPSSEETPPLPDNVFISRYRLNFGQEGSAPGTVVIAAYDGNDEEWPRMELEEEISDAEEASEVVSSHPVSRRNSLQSEASVVQSQRSSSSSLSSDDESVSGGSTAFSQEDDLMPETEGSQTNANINVGRGFQVDVPPFVPGQAVASRNPTLVWKPNAISQEILDAYLEESSKILNEYMEQNGLVVDDPYAPLPSCRIAAMVLAENNGAPLTLSRVSTASSLSSETNNLTRECKLDALLTTLNDENYNSKDALRVVAASPQNYLTIWTKREKDSFNSVFRRYSGSLRMISKTLSSSKTFKDVVDYHYRFKIPDQFRRYQEKKREQALRMMECVEQRRSVDAPILPRDFGGASKHAKKAKDEWNKTGGSDVTRAVQERRVAAKDLFLQVQNELGTQTMNELAVAVKSLTDGSVQNLKDTIVELLQEQPELLDRFLAFLPKRFRGVPPNDANNGYPYHTS